MFMKACTVAAILAASTTFALARPDGPGPGPRHEMRHPGGPMGDGPPPPPMGKGFDLRLGRGVGLRIECGDETLKACMDAAMPLINQTTEAAKMMPPPPPPRGDMGGPPHMGDKAPPPPPMGDKVPPPPPAN